MINYSIHAEYLKIKRSSFKRFLIIFPISFNILILGYIFLTKQSITNDKFFFNYFSILTFLLPAVVCFLMTLLWDIEKEPSNLKNILGLGGYHQKLISLKFIFAFLTITLMYLVNLFFTIIIFIILKTGIDVIVHFIFGYLICWALFLTTFVIFYFMNILFSFTTMMLIAATGSLLTAIVGLTSLGNSFWLLVPFSWSSRMTTLLANNDHVIPIIIANKILIIILVLSAIPSYYLLKSITLFIIRR
ncbi:hypothetical protein [Staphylococcus americanisciuri]|uniref:Lantibiotic ABC transporter permease n=1 Tax=Staphylococcus americanisciuri TaxID=2973940 RepID=A0ABT2F380_9STAP|nr:hypothetical protein [Staphylococcus americanisciuri]MCS4486925.1 hypothetical protein [Staphylococcus americanisciuri]